MPNPLTPVLKPLGLDPSQGYDQAAAGAREAQQQAGALSDLQWQRQMQGLGQATGYVDQLQSLYNSMYSPGGGAMAAGGRGPQAPGLMQGSAMSMLTPPAKQPPPGGGAAQFNPDLVKDGADFIPGLGTASRFATLLHDPSWSNAGRAGASFVPGANLAYDAGKSLLGKLF